MSRVFILTVSFVYRPPNCGIAVPVPAKGSSPVLPRDQSDSPVHSNYVPVGVLSFSCPEYPVSSLSWASVVAQLTVDDSGRITGVDLLNGMEGFNNVISKALKAWGFHPAKFDGKSIASKIVIAFVFQPPPEELSFGWTKFRGAGQPSPSLLLTKQVLPSELSTPKA